MKETKTKGELKFAFLGDLMLGGEFISYAEKGGKDFLYPFRAIEPLLSDVDIIFLNLEGPIFEGPNKRPDVTSILSNHPSVLTWLKNKPGVSIVSLANNHIMDYGAEGLKQTINKLKDRGIYYVGAGKTSDEAFEETIIEIKHRRIAFLAYTSDEPYVGSVLSKPDSEGCASFLVLDKLIEKVREVNKCVDIICVSLHWGHELYLYPSYEQVKIAHSLVNAGANFIIGHHPHVIQGIEKSKTSLVMYSLGNFFLPDIKNTMGRIDLRKSITKEFLLIKCNVDITMLVSTEIVGGFVRKDYRITPYEFKENISFVERVDYLSKPISRWNYDQFWVKYKAQRTRELSKEELLDAFKKLFKMMSKEVLRSISFDDIRRNLRRALALLKRNGK